MIEDARTHGVRGFKADVLRQNAPMLHVLKQANATVTVSLGDGCFEVRQLFDSPATSIDRGILRPLPAS